MISEGVQFNQTTALTLSIRTDRPDWANSVDTFEIQLESVDSTRGRIQDDFPWGEGEGVRFDQISVFTYSAKQN